MSEGKIPLKSLSVDQLKIVCNNKNLLADENCSKIQIRLPDSDKANLRRKTGEDNEFLIDLQQFQLLMISCMAKFDNQSEEMKRRMLRQNLQKIMQNSLFYVFEMRWYSIEYTIEIKKIEEILIHMNNVYLRIRSEDADFNQHAVEHLWCEFCRQLGHQKSTCSVMRTFGENLCQNRSED